MGAMTQDELAKLTGLSQSTINRIVRDTFKPQIKTLQRLAKALNVSPEYLTSSDKKKASIIYEIDSMDEKDLDNVLTFIKKEKLYKSIN